MIYIIYIYSLEYASAHAYKIICQKENQQNISAPNSNKCFRLVPQHSTDSRPYEWQNHLIKVRCSASAVRLIGKRKVHTGMARHALCTMNIKQLQIIVNIIQIYTNRR